MSSRRSRWRHALPRVTGSRFVSAALAGLVGLTGPAAVAAEIGPAPKTPTRQAPQADPSSGWNGAVRLTQQAGVPSVLVVTSASAPGSHEAARALLTSNSLKRLAGVVSAAEVSAESDPAQVQQLRPSKFPTTIVLRRGQSGSLERAGCYEGAMTPEETVGWLLGLGVVTRAGEKSAAATPGSGEADPGVVKTLFGHANESAPSPSPQAVQAPPVYYPPPAYFPPPQAPAPRQAVERPVERRVVRRAVPKRRSVVVVERPAPRNVVQYEVVEEEEAPAPRSLLVRPREAEPTEEVEVVEEEVEAAPRRAVVAAPRERTVVVAEAPREALPRVAVVEQPDVALIQPGPIDRLVGGVGNRLRRRALPRVDLQVETQRTYRLAPPAPSPRMVVAAPREAVPTYAPAPAPAPVYAAPPQYLPPPQYPAPSPQAR